MDTEEQRFKKLIEHAPEAITLLSADHKLQYASASAARMFGYEVEEMIGVDPALFTHPDDLPRVVTPLVDLMQKPGKVITLEYRFRHKDGRWRWIESTISNLLAEPGVNAILFNFRDITERVEAEKALRESEERFRLAFRTSPDAININRLSDGLYIDINEGFTQVTGYTRADVIGKLSTEINIWHDPTDRRRLVSELTEHGQVNNLEAKFRLKDGCIVRALMSAKVILLDGVPHTLSITRDIEKLKQTEDALSKSEERYRMLIEQASDGIFLADPQGNYIDVSPSGCAMFGYSRDEILGMSMIDLLFPEDRAMFANVVQRIQHHQETLIEYKLRRKDGTPIHVEINGKLLADGRMQGMVRDITERIEADIARRDSEELFRTAFRTSPDSIHINRLADGLIVDVNEGFTKICGFTREETIGKKSSEINIWHDPADRDRLVAGLQANGEVNNLEAKFRMKNGSVVRSLMSAKVIMLNGVPHILSISRDIEQLKQMEDALSESNRRLEVTLDELRQMQSQLVQQERLAAVGQLAAGIAHDFNNILAVITLHAQMARSAADLPARVGNRLDIIVQQVKQAADLAQQMLDFGRRSVLRMRQVNLVSLFNEQIRLLRRTLPSHVVIRFSHAAEEYAVQADPTRIQQMLTNLALNARDAMPDGGELSIHLDHFSVNQADIAPLPEMTVGDWVCVTVSDTGAGITPEVLPRIFEPFFTTKEPGHGTGLGLSQVYGIIKQHNGHIGVQTEAGVGTTITLYLPMQTTSVPAPDFLGHKNELPCGHGETVLVVEDNAILRTALVEMLGLLDYAALAVANGKEALAILDDQTTGIDIILSDLIMPEMGGQALLRAIRQRGLALPVVIISGHPIEHEMSTLDADGRVHWLLKPIEPGQLAEILSVALAM